MRTCHARQLFGLKRNCELPKAALEPARNHKGRGLGDTFCTKFKLTFHTKNETINQNQDICVTSRYPKKKKNSFSILKLKSYIKALPVQNSSAVLSLTLTPPIYLPLLVPPSDPYSNSLSSVMAIGELAFPILQLLQPIQLVQLRRVSKHWRNLIAHVPVEVSCLAREATQSVYPGKDEAVFYTLLVDWAHCEPEVSQNDIRSNHPSINN